MFQYDASYHEWSSRATFAVLLVQLFKTVHLPCSAGGLGFFLNGLRAGGYYVASFVLFFMWFNVLYYDLSSCVMIRRCYGSIFGIISRGQMLKYPMDLFCGGVAILVVLVGHVGMYVTSLHHFNTLQGDGECFDEFDTLIWLGLLVKMAINMVFNLWQCVLVNGSFIASTTAQTTVDDATIPQFTRKLPQLQLINAVLLFDQLLLILFDIPLTADLQLFYDSRWLLVVYYAVSLALICRVRSRLRNAITKPSEDGGEKQKDESWYDACKDNVLKFVKFLIRTCPDNHVCKCLLIHVTFTWFTILLSAYNGNNDCFLWSHFHFSAAYVFFRVNCRHWGERTNRTDVYHFALVPPVLVNAFHTLWYLGSCSGQDRGLWYFCLSLNVVMTAVFILHQVYLLSTMINTAWRGETIDASSGYIVKQTYLYFAAVFTSLSLYALLSSMQAENFYWFIPAFGSFLFQFLFLVVVLWFAYVWNPKETTPQQDSGGMTDAPVQDDKCNPGSSVDSYTSFSHQPPVNPSHEKQD